MAGRKRILYGPAGQIVHLHDDRISAHTASLGDDVELRRASHVEPTQELFRAYPAAREWLICEHMATHNEVREVSEAVVDAFPPLAFWADMMPSNGPVLGPFPTRERALAEEVDWMNRHNHGHNID